MQIQAKDPNSYIGQLSPERQEAMSRLRNAIVQNLPEGFEETMGYGMIGYVVPRNLYPAGYHCDPKLPLPFMNLASQKNFIALYHMGIYGSEELLNWFTGEFPKHSKAKLDMGKSCIRFKKLDDIPYGLIGELVKKITPQMWIEMYEKNMKR